MLTWLLISELANCILPLTFMLCLTRILIDSGARTWVNSFLKKMEASAQLL